MDILTLRTGLCIIIYTFFVHGLDAVPNQLNDSRKTGENYTLTIRMPNAVSDKPDALLCHAVQLPETESYILKYEPHATKRIAHHMMVYGCGSPGSKRPYWKCGEMDDRSESSVCSDGERQIVYAWALDASDMKFPPDVGFRVSGSTRIKYIVIQLHYKDAFEDGQTDNSGITLQLTTKRQPKQAGFYVHASYGMVPSHTPEFHAETACQYTGKPIVALAYRTHSHNLGMVTSGYRIRNSEWTEIGRMSPQLPQSFYNVTNPVRIQEWDILASRCTMRSERSTPTRFGPANKDEMCNFYILYYTEAQENLQIRYCMKDANSFKWKDHLANIPDQKASSVDGLPEFTMNDVFAE